MFLLGPFKDLYIIYFQLLSFVHIHDYCFIQLPSHALLNAR